VTAGLCARCVHCHVIRARRSVFYLCMRSRTDPRFPRYPRLPVLQCVGHDPGTPSEGAASEDADGGR